MSKVAIQKVYLGINEQARLDHFSAIEEKIIRRFEGERYVTNGGGNLI